MLYSIIILPIELIVNWVFSFFYNTFSQYGVIAAIFGVSFTINLLALPLYNVADALQEKERKIARSLEDRVKRIKKAFKGDEQFMMLSTYYRQNNYHPLYVLRSSLSILIEIPFFIAAYHFLSHCPALMGAKFWIFSDLGKPDAFFHIGSFQINVLPILMTAINFISGAVYTKEAPMREKVQLYAVAAIFLVLLYSSPSGLVLYWILNNLFSLAKNVVKQQKNPLQLFHRLMSLVVCAVGVLFCIKTHSFTKRGIILAAMLVVVFADKLFLFAKKILGGKFTFEDQNDKYNLPLLLLSGAGLTLLCGVFLPSGVISSSTVEFSFLGETASPLSYVKETFFVFLGLFLFWPFCIYKMSSIRVRRIEPVVMLVVFFFALANVFIFKFDYGKVDLFFSFENTDVLKHVSLFNTFMPLLFLFLLIAVIPVLLKLKKESVLLSILGIFCLAETGTSFIKINQINREFGEYKKTVENKSSLKEIKPCYHFTRDGKNVVVLFLDKAVSSMMPYVLDSYKDFEKDFEGFTYYPNTLSFSSNTDIGAPAMMAGYEYTPEEINKRENEFLPEKHNEASLVMPKLFYDAGFDVTVTDPPLPNYTWKGDLSAFESLPDINVCEFIGNLGELFKKDKQFDCKSHSDTIVYNEIKNFAILQILIPSLRQTFYSNVKSSTYSDQLYERGLKEYYSNYSCLHFMNKLTDFTGKKNQFMFITNELTHDPLMFNNDFTEPLDRNDTFWNQTFSEDINQVIQISTMVAVLKKVGEWIHYLKENEVFDNTRIIIVSDHGAYLKSKNFDKIQLEDIMSFKVSSMASMYNPLFMVKDFNQRSAFNTDYTFMTNADTIFFAKSDFNISETNPFTGKKFMQIKENGINVYPCSGFEAQVPIMKDKKKFTLDSKLGFHISKNIFEQENWIPIKEWEKIQSK